jgi:DNA-binding MarR family transcriptional regulator
MSKDIQMPKQNIQDEPENLLKLENQLCFMLYSASRKMTAAYRPLLSELGITYPQYLVLMVLWEYFDITGQASEQIEPTQIGIKVGMLSSKLQLDNGTLTPLLKRMALQGLIVRKRDEQDERVVRIYLTENGILLRVQACEIPEKLLCASGLRGDELKRIYSELSGVLKKIPGIM